jgi:hypothetical protein
MKLNSGHKTQDAICSLAIASSGRRRTAYFLLLFCVLYLMSCVLCLSSSSAARCTLSVGHLPLPANGRTFLLITDLSGSGPDVEISFYNDVGHKVSSAHKLLPPNGKAQIRVENHLKRIAGTIVLESSSDQIVGEYWQIYESGAIFMLPLQSPDEAGRYFVNCFRFPSCGSNLLILSDPCGSGPEVQMEFYSRTGELIRVARKLLRPYGTLAFEVNDYVPWDILGKVSVRSFRGSIVLHHRLLCGNSVGAKAIAIAVPARLPARELLIDEFSTGAEIASNLVIADSSAEGPATTIQFRSDDGAVRYELEKLLPPNGVLLIDPADYVSGVAGGTIKIIGEAGIIADYWERNPQTILDTPAVECKPGSAFSISYFSPFEDTQNLLSLLNVGREPAKLEIQFYSNDGKEIASKELSLEPYKQVDELMDRYFDAGHTGTIIIESTNASLVITSHIFDLKNSRHLGKAHAQVVR